MEVDAPDLAGLYRRFAEVEAHGSSPSYERLCLAVAEDAAVLSMLAGLPRGKRQPNLFLGALRLLGADVGDPTAALAFAVARADAVREVMLTRSTQTNEPARCAVLLPALALLPGPLALLEVGASAGLCLLYDRYRYAYTDDSGLALAIGSGALALPCEVAGVPLPDRVPEITARLGLDLNPLDAGDPDVARWLRCLVWPEHTERAERLDRALALAAADPPRVLRGSAPQDLPDAVVRLRSEAPGATVVVLHSATVAYLEPAERRRFAQVCDDLAVHRLGLEGAVPTGDLGVDLPDGDWGGQFLLSLDDAVLGHADPHGRALAWLTPESKECS